MADLSHLFKAHDHDVVDKTAPVLKNTKAVQMMIVGAKRSGKSTLILSLLSSAKLYKNYFHNIYMISPSTSDGKMLPLIRELEGQGKFYKELTEGNIEKILNEIKAEQDALKMKEKKLKKKLPPIHNLLILDDVMADLPRSFKKNKITSLFMNARHYSLSTMIVSQVYKGVPAQVRKQTDVIYTFPVVKKEKEAMIEDWDIPHEIFDAAFEDESDHPFLTVNVVSKQHPAFFRKMTPIEMVSESDEE
jgi:GTPase SAR1 family protein